MSEVQTDIVDEIPPKPKIVVYFDTIPDELKKEDRWFNWNRTTYNKSQQKWNKVL